MLACSRSHPKQWQLPSRCRTLKVDGVIATSNLYDNAHAEMKALMAVVPKHRSK